MIGAKTFEIGPQEFLTGVTSSPNTTDGGMSPETFHMNITAKPGALYPPGAETNASTNLTDEIIASCEDPAYLGADRLLVAKDETFYTFNGTSLTLEETATDFGVQQGVTDMVPFVGEVVVSGSVSNNDLGLWDKSAGFIEDWWTNTLSQAAGLSTTTAWRPLLVYEKHLYIGDGEKLHRVNESLTVNNGILTLLTTDRISALGTDQGTGKMLIATTGGANASASRYAGENIYVYDGFSNKALKVVPISGLVTAFRNVGNITYVFYGNKIGYWTGSGIEFLRELNAPSAGGAGGSILYPHRVTHINNTLYYVDTVDGLAPGGGAAVNRQIMAYGETINGVKAFYPVLDSSIPSSAITCLTAYSQTDLCYSFASSKFYHHDVTSIAAVINGGAVMYSKRYKFARDTTFHGAIIEFDQAAPSGDNNLLSLSVIDSKGNTTALPSFNPGTRSDIYEYETTWPTIETRSIQLKINWGGNGSNVLGIRRVTVFYTPKE